MADKTRDFLGSGWKFPPRLDSRGRVELIHQEQDVEEAIRIVLMTNQGERPMRPEFGSELFRLQFAPNNGATAGLAQRYTMEALARWEPRIELRRVSAYPDERDSSRCSSRSNIRFRLPTRNTIWSFPTISFLEGTESYVAAFTQSG